jgi:colanic acid/amylovoran biosynthesis glycosyltransferase
MGREFLYIIVSSYPYGYGEAFLENELREIHAEFKHIYIVIPESNNIDVSRIRYWIPDNASIVMLKKKRSMMNFMRALLYWLKPIIHEEVKLINGPYKLKLNFSHVKLITSFISSGISFAEQLRKVISSNGHKPNNTTLYSYWFTDVVFGLMIIKKDNSQFNVCSRLHGWDCFFYRNKENYLPLRAGIFKVLDSICPVSQAGKDHLIEKTPNINHDNIKVYNLGVQIELSDYPLKYSKSKLRLVSIAFVHHVKRLHLIIDALALIDSIEVEWTHIGSWSDETEWHKKHAFDKLGIKKNIKYTFLGEISQDEVHKFLEEHKADFLLNVSESEGLPVSMMEALAAGVPVISTSVGGVPEIISHNYNGFLMLPNPTKEQIADFLSDISLMDEDIYKEITLNCRKSFVNKWQARKNYNAFAAQILQNIEC